MGLGPTRSADVPVRRLASPARSHLDELLDRAATAFPPVQRLVLLATFLSECATRNLDFATLLAFGSRRVLAALLAAFLPGYGLEPFGSRAHARVGDAASCAALPKHKLGLFG